MLRIIHSLGAPSPRSMVHIFAIGGTVSGYASMGSAESLSDKMLDTRHVVQEALEEVRYPGRNKFRYQFAKELNEQSLNANEITAQQGVRKHVQAKIYNSLIDVPHPQEASNSKSDLIRLKLENKQLKLKIDKCLVEEEKYRNMKYVPCQ